jgi:hypothetical protein
MTAIMSIRLIVTNLSNFLLNLDQLRLSHNNTITQITDPTQISNLLKINPKRQCYSSLRYMLIKMCDKLICQYLTDL